MKAMRGVWLYAALVGLALALSLAAGPGTTDSPIPSVDNPGPLGVAVPPGSLPAAASSLELSASIREPL